jgi:membrane-associated protein
MSLELIISWVLAYKYFIIFPLAIVEGPIIMVVSGFLLHLGYFDFWPLYLVLMVGDLAADVLWYGIGHHGARPFIKRYGHLLGITEALFLKLEEAFHAHHMKILFISKVTMGFGFAIATLIAAGATRVPLRQYILINFVGGFIWTGLLMAVGYVFGNFYLLIDEGLRIVFIVTLSIAILALVLGFGNARRKRFIKDTQ